MVSQEKNDFFLVREGGRQLFEHGKDRLQFCQFLHNHLIVVAVDLNGRRSTSCSTILMYSSEALPWLLEDCLGEFA